MKMASVAGTLFLAVIFELAGAAPARYVTISGKIIDDPFPMERMSAPVQGAKLYLTGISSAGSAANPSVLATSDQSGNFSFEPTGAYSYRLSVTHENYNNREIVFTASNDTSMTILVVPKGAHGSFAGSVRISCPLDCLSCAKTPLPGCYVTVYKHNPVLPGSALAYSLPYYMTTTNASGQYSIDSVPVSFNGERVTVTARLSGYGTATLDTTLRNMLPTTLNFNLIATNTPKDSLSINPRQPTNRDSVTFSLYNSAYCCCTAYSKDSVTVNDTAIYLNYTYDETRCQFCDCMGNGSWTTFKKRQLPAGKYAVYKNGIPQCPPDAFCKLAPERTWLGTLTVVQSSSGAFRSADAAHSGYPARFRASGTGIDASLLRGGMVTIKALSLRGELLFKPLERQLGAGSYRLPLSALVNGVYAGKPVILDVAIDGFTAGRIVIMNVNGK
jgi:hypothetical protein